MMKFKVDVMKKEIRMSKIAYKAACLVGSAEYEALHQIRRENSDFNLVVETRKSNNDPFKNLTFEYMKKYIAGHDEDGKIMAEYEEKRGTSKEAKEMGAVSYTLPQMKEWFLEKYPVVREYHEERETERRELSKKRKATMTKKTA